MALNCFQPWRPTTVGNAGLIEFLELFLACFRGLAPPEPQVGAVMPAVAALPKEDLAAVARNLRMKVDSFCISEWRSWLDEKGGKALVTARMRPSGPGTPSTTKERVLVCESYRAGHAGIGQGTTSPAVGCAVPGIAQPLRLRGDGAAPGQAVAPVPALNCQTQRPSLRVPVGPLAIL